MRAENTVGTLSEKLRRKQMDGRPMNDTELIVHFSNSEWINDGHDGGRLKHFIEVFQAKIDGIEKLSQVRDKLKADLTQAEYAIRNAENRAERNEYLAKSSQAFEDEIKWLRALVEKLTA